MRRSTIKSEKLQPKLKAALKYTNLGLSIIPLKETGKEKKPYIKWKKYQNNPPSRSQVKKWFTKWPNANIGLVIGFYMIVLDFDSEDARNAFRERIEYNKRKPKKIRKKNAVDKFLTSNTLGTHFICDLCGTVIRSRTYYDKRAEKTRYQYGCSRQLTSNKQLKLRGKEKCHMPAINADGFDIEVWDSVITLLSNPLKYLKSWKPFEEQKSVNNTIKQLEKKMRKKQRELDRFTKRIVKVSDARIVESYQKEQHELSEKIRHISADIGVLQRKNKASTDSIKYIKKLVEEAEKAVWEMEQIVAGKEPGDVEDVIIPTIYDEFENLKSYQVKKEVLEAVVSPEQGGFVKMTYDRNEERHYVELDAKLNYLRIGRIIKALTNGTLADGSFFNPNYGKLIRKQL